MSEKPVLVVEGLEVRYGNNEPVLHDLSLEVREGEQLAVLGANGAGKSTLMMAISGHLMPSKGRIWLNGVDITKTSSTERVELGLVLALEGHRIVSDLTVDDNLRLALWGAGVRSRQAIRERLRRTYETFELLDRMKKRDAGTMSGGEQQMLVIARLLIVDPAVLLVDEPSFGLAPIFVSRVYDYLAEAKKLGKPVLVVEQSIDDALLTSDSICVLQLGRMSPPMLAAAISREDISRAYLEG